MKRSSTKPRQIGPADVEQDFDTKLLAANPINADFLSWFGPPGKGGRFTFGLSGYQVGVAVQGFETGQDIRDWVTAIRATTESAIRVFRLAEDYRLIVYRLPSDSKDWTPKQLLAYRKKTKKAIFSSYPERDPRAQVDVAGVLSLLPIFARGRPHTRGEESDEINKLIQKTKHKLKQSRSKSIWGPMVEVVWDRFHTRLSEGACRKRDYDYRHQEPK